MGRAPKVDGKELHFGDPNGRGRPFDEIPSGTEENKLASARSRQEAQMSDVEAEGQGGGKSGVVEPKNTHKPLALRLFFKVHFSS